MHRLAEELIERLTLVVCASFLVNDSGYAQRRGWLGARLEVLVTSDDLAILELEADAWLCWRRSLLPGLSSGFLFGILFSYAFARVLSGRFCKYLISDVRLRLGQKL